jgi:hypothetical protein
METRAYIRVLFIIGWIGLFLTIFMIVPSLTI